jgi:hypothetical protein
MKAAILRAGLVGGPITGGLDSLARENGVTAKDDCGVAPGTSNLLDGRVDRLLVR